MKSYRLFVTVFSVFFLLQQAVIAEEKNELHPKQGVSLSIEEAAELAATHSFDVRLAGLDVQITETGIDEARSAYDHRLSAELSHQNDKTPNPYVFLGTHSKNTRFNAEAGRLFSWGGEAKLRYESLRTWTNNEFSELNPFYEGSLAFSYIQPLLQNFGGILEKGEVELARIAVAGMELSSRDRVEKAVFETEIRYWDVFRAESVRRVNQEAFWTAERLLKVNRERLDVGLVEEPDVLQSEALVERKRAALMRSETDVEIAMKALRVTINARYNGWYEVTDAVEEKDCVIILEDCLKASFELRRDLRILAERAREKDVILRISKNRSLPRLDLLASLRENGLDREFGEAQEDWASGDHPTLEVGLRVSYPWENRAAKSAVRRARIEKARVLVEMDKLQKDILFEVDRNYRSLLLEKNLVVQRKKIEGIEKKKYEAERRRYLQGRSSVDLMVRFEDDYHIARIATVEALTRYEKAKAALRRSMNKTLKHYGLE